MLLIDMSQIVLSNLFATVKPGQPISEDFLRHQILSSLLYYKQKFSPKYGRLVLCFDNRHYWRKEVFPNYKFHRKKDREDSGFDWGLIFDTIHLIRDELREFMPYQVMDVENSEADDIIGVLAKKNHLSEKVLILSGDKDFGQLQRFKNIDQYAPIQKEWVKIEDPTKFLRFHIMKGDRGDGIPNFLSADDVFVKGIRQKTLPRAEKLETWACLTPDRFCTTEMMYGWTRNEMLVDLDKIPDSIQQKIITAFKQPYNDTNNKIFDYFIKKGLKRLMSDIDGFLVPKSTSFMA